MACVLNIYIYFLRSVAISLQIKSTYNLTQRNKRSMLGNIEGLSQGAGKREG